MSHPSDTGGPRRAGHPSADAVGTKRLWVGDSTDHPQVYVKVDTDLWQMEDFPVLHADDDMMVGCEVVGA